MSRISKNIVRALFERLLFDRWVRIFLQSKEDLAEMIIQINEGAAKVDERLVFLTEQLEIEVFPVPKVYWLKPISSVTTLWIIRAQKFYL